jgi:hypothetical protein
MEVGMKSVVAVVLALGILPGNGQAGGREPAEPSVAEVMQEVAIERYEIDMATAPIRSLEELHRYLRENPESPLHRMSDKARRRFISKLVFTPKGLGSFSHLELSGMSVSDAYRILSLFGQQGLIRAVPGLKAESKLEESMLLLAPSPQAIGPSHYICIVWNRGPHLPTAFCEYEYGSVCSSACSGGR